MAVSFFLYLLDIREKAVNLHTNRDLYLDVGTIDLLQYRKILK